MDSRRTQDLSLDAASNLNYSEDSSCGEYDFVLFSFCGILCKPRVFFTQFQSLSKLKFSGSLSMLDFFEM